jgi:hypothetical protein
MHPRCRLLELFCRRTGCRRHGLDAGASAAKPQLIAVLTTVVTVTFAQPLAARTGLAYAQRHNAALAIKQR